MIVSKLTGGMGNQLFQYAIARSMSLKFNTDLKFDITSFQWDELREFELTNFNVFGGIASESEIQKVKSFGPTLKNRIKYKLINKKIPYYLFSNIKEKGFDYNTDIELLDNKNIYLDGYWQSERYFIKYRSFLLNEISLKNKLSKVSVQYQKLIEQIKNSVSLHVRRGDYIKNSETNTFHGVCDIEYYKKSINYMLQYLNNPTFFIFSDDKEYVKEVFSTIPNCIIVNGVKVDVEELFLMSYCKHNITANSSFSWWGAWLNKNESKIVISPKKWFANLDMQNQTNDLIPSDWLKI